MEPGREAGRSPASRAGQAASTDRRLLLPSRFSGRRLLLPVKNKAASPKRVVQRSRPLKGRPKGLLDQNHTCTKRRADLL